MSKSMPGSNAKLIRVVSSEREISIERGNDNVLTIQTEEPSGENSNYNSDWRVLYHSDLNMKLAKTVSTADIINKVEVYLGTLRDDAKPDVHVYLKSRNQRSQSPNPQFPLRNQ